MLKHKIWICFLLGSLLLFSSFAGLQAAAPVSKLQQGKTLLQKGQKLNLLKVSDQAYLACSGAAEMLKNGAPEDYMLARLGKAEALLQMSAVFSCFQEMQEVEVYLKKHFKPSHKIYIRFLNLKGELHFANREVEETLEAWYEAKRLTMKHYGLNSPQLAAHYAEIGKCYFAGGRKDSSFHYAGKALEILRKQPQPLLEPVATAVYALYARHFVDKEFYTAGLKQNEVVHNGKKYPAKVFVNLIYLDSALQSAKKVYGPESQMAVKVMLQKVATIPELIVYEKSRDLEKARELDISGSKLNDTVVRLLEKHRSPELVFYYQALGLTAVIKGTEDQVKRGETLFWKSLKWALPNYKGKSVYDVPAIEQVFSENHLGIALETITYYFIGKYRQTGDIKFLEIANQYALRSLDLAGYIRQKKNLTSRETNKPAILFQSWNYGMAIETAYLLYQKTGKEIYKKQAFHNIEKFKNLNLVQAALDNKLARNVENFEQLEYDFKSISARILRKQEQMHIARNYTLLHKQEPFASAVKELATTKAEMEALERKTRANAPEFYNARINNAYADNIETVQRRIPDNKTAVISYFLNIDYDFNREAYILVVQKDRTDFLQTRLPFRYEGKIDSLLQAITTSNLPVYRQLASQFYNILIKPTDKVLDKNVKNLMIMPDGQLWQIPFGTLLTHHVTTSNYRKLPYLIKKYCISYQHSATLNKLGKEIAALQDQKFEKPMLAMAPFADKSLAGQIASGKINLMSGELSDGTYAKLPYTIDLLQKLQQRITGLFLIDKDATEENFKANAGKFSIIHLATHAETDMANPLNSKFMMAKSPNEDGELHMSELLDLDVKPHLAVLSACETGKGMIDTKSEGMTSLSWGFYYLGCPSTLSTLWKVDDRQTSTVLTSFYNYLFEGKSKEEALQQAKLDFIAKARTSDEANPFYWSGLVLTGDPGPMPEVQKPFWQQAWFLVSAVLLLVFIAFLSWQKQKNRRTLPQQIA